MPNIVYLNICFVLQRMSLKAIASHLVEIMYISIVFDNIKNSYQGFSIICPECRELKIEKKGFDRIAVHLRLLGCICVNGTHCQVLLMGPSTWLQTGAVLEICWVVSKQPVCCECIRWNLRAKFLVTLQHKFLRRSSIFLSGNQKKKGGGSSLYFLNLELKQRPVNTAIQPAVYASWNVVAEKGHTHRQVRILSGFRKPQKPL